jgi:hypothetical protein
MPEMTQRKKLEDVRTMFEQLGIGDYKMPMAIQFAWILPRISDPYAPGVILIIQGLQTGLNKLGFDLPVDGGLGKKTVAALRRVSGPKWYDKTWLQLAGDVVTAEPIKKAKYLGKRTSGPEGLGTTMFGDLFASPLPWIGIGVAIWKWDDIKRWICRR